MSNALYVTNDHFYENVDRSREGILRNVFHASYILHRGPTPLGENFKAEKLESSSYSICGGYP
jgi:hypothetical protein